MVGGVANVAYYLPKALAKRANVTYFPRFTQNIDYSVNLFNVYRKFLMKKFDIIHFNLIPTYVDGSSLLLKFAKHRDAHTVLTIHGIIQLEHQLEPEFGSVPQKVLSKVLNSCNSADRIVVNSQYMRTNVVNWYRIERDKSVVIPNGVDLKKFNECDEKVALDGDPAILYVGSPLKMKGFDVLIQAIANLRPELPNVRLHLVGSGIPNLKLARGRAFAISKIISDFHLLVKKKGIQEHVVFHNWVSHSTIPRYYKSADFCVFPSRHEGFGISVLEAMSSGIPLIASDIGSFREIVSDGENGILFKQEDDDALSKAILTLHQNPDLRKRISGNALRTAERFSWEDIAEKYISLYRHLCE